MRTLLFIIFSFLILHTKAQTFKDGEWLKYRIHYGLINAGYATIKLDEIKKDNQPAFHVTGNGWTVGVTKFFFKVEDNYETWFYKNNMKPYHFKRRVDEGGYIISRDIYFDYNKNLATVHDHKKDEKKEIAIQDVQDMISCFYYLRTKDFGSLDVGESFHVDMFFDYESFPFKMKYLGMETINTKYGKMKCYKFIPLVQSGRVFEADESVTVWVTADKNKIPIRIQASLVVGSLKADLDEYKGLANPLVNN